MATDNDGRFASRRCSVINQRSSSGQLEPTLLTYNEQDDNVNKRPKEAQIGVQPLQLSQMVWMKRQNPEWKPRRASVASCQQQQVMYNYHCKDSSDNSSQPGQSAAFSIGDQSAGSRDWKKFLSQRIQQKLQQQQQPPSMQRRRYLTEATGQESIPALPSCIIKVNSNSMESGQEQVEQEQQNAALANKSSTSGQAKKCAHLQCHHHHRNCNHHLPHHNIKHGRRHRRSTCREPLPSDKTQSSGSKQQEQESPTRSEQANKPSQVLTLCSPAGSTCVSIPQAADSVAIELPLQVDCSRLDGKRIGSVSASAALTTVTMNEKLQLQDKQRKFFIISMGIKQMISANSGLLNFECTSCGGSKCCRTFASADGSRINDDKSQQRRRVRKKSKKKRNQDVPGVVHTDISRLNSVEDSKLLAVQSLKEEASTCAGESSSERQAESESEVECNQGEIIPKCALASQQIEAKELADSNSTDCHNSTDSFKSERLGSEAEKFEMTRDDVDVNTSERFQHESHLETSTSHTSSKASFESDTSYNKCHSHERQEDDGGGVDEENDDDSDDINLESLIVESWLDDHPDFVHDYFMRKASKRLIDDWLVNRAKVSNTNLMVGSQLDLMNFTQANGQQVNSAASSPYPFSGHLQNLASFRACSESPGKVVCIKTSDPPTLSRMSVGAFKPTGSRSQSGAATPVRKISATDFESRTGSGFLRPMVSTTPDGRPTFLSQLGTDGSSQYGDTGEVVQSRQLVLGRQSKQVDIEVTVNEGDKNENDTENKEVSNDEEVKLIFELVKNICNDLDIRTLLHKILRNIAILINADKSSLFLVRGEPGDPNRHLVSQLFNVDQDSECGEPELDDCITIPWSTGLVGYVAESGESVNIANCYEDPRFTDTIDQRTGYVTKHMLCAPIYDKQNEIVGVAQVINKRDGKPFSESDEVKFKRYLQFCGIGLRNAQSYENCQLENKRNQVLLDLARMVFEEQSTIEQVVYRIMLHTQSLLECQRCQVLLIDDGSEDLDHLLQPYSYHQHQTTRNSESDTNSLLTTSMRPTSDLSPKLFSLVFDLECDAQDLVMHNNKIPTELSLNKPSSTGDQTATSNKSRPFPLNIGITGYVAMTGETLNIEDAYESERFDPKVDEGSDFRHKSILCMPIRNGQRQIIGVSQLINKKNGRPFNKNDEDLFEAFAIFCGLGIHNTLMYEKVLKVMAKQRVTFEVLSYHATAPLEEAKKLHLEQVPSCFALNLASLRFDDFALDEQYMLISCMRFFLDLDLIRRFKIDQLVFCNWILSVQKNYRKVTYHPIVGGNGLKAAPVCYHNWRHAFNVSQMMFAILINTRLCEALGELETLALLIACLCHDLDHRGTNNSFQIKSASPLAELYSTSTMEHHHFDQCVMILNSQGNQILANLSPDEYSRVIVLLEEAILATDLANYFQKRELFFKLVDSNRFDWRNNPEHRSLLRCMLMTACDVAAITKPWSIQKVVADLVMGEFYQQGDIEKQELNLEPSDMMNRDKMSKLPEMQIGFIDSICAPIYTSFAKIFPQELGQLLDGCLLNRSLWVDLAKKNNGYTSEIPSYLNNNSTSIMKILPKFRNTSSLEMNNSGEPIEDSLRKSV